MKRSVVLIAVLSILLASCGGSGWSCKKRYCDIKKVDIVKKEIMFPEKVVLVQP